ncbi:trimethylamine methyltransferase family protein [Ahrensia sp. R2A130]|nr:trimethylamine methyltransferase family protein [Ahrensia sp. R2A130]
MSNDNLAFDAINEAVLGVGHTIAAMERDYFYTSLADRLESRTLAENGAKDAWTVARERVRDVLANYHPDYLSSDQDAAIRRRFDIL